MGPEEQRNAQVVLTADTGNYAQQMASARAETDRTVESVNRLLAAVDNLTKRAGRNLQIVSAATTAGIVAATVAAGRFEQQLSTLQAQAAIAGRSIDRVGDPIDRIRRSLPVTTDQVVALATQLQKLGVNPSNIEKLSRLFIQMGAATGEDTSSLSRGMIELQRQMGTSADSTEAFANSLTHLSAKMGVSATGVLQFAQALAPIGRAVGMSQTEIMGISAAFQKAGQDGFLAASAFTKMLSDISRATRYGSNDLAMYANLVGKTTEQFRGMSATDQLVAITEAINRQGPDAIKTLERMGLDGVRAMNAIQGVTQSGSLRSAISEAAAGFSSEAVTKGATEAMNGLADSLTWVRNVATSIAQAFGQTFLPAVTALTDGLARMLGVVRTLMEPLSGLMGIVAAAGAGGAGILGSAMTALGPLGLLAGGVALRRNAFGAGMASRRWERTGVQPGGMYQRSIPNYLAGGGSRAGQMLFRAGQTAYMFSPRRFFDERVPGAGTPLGPRLAMLGAMGWQGVMGAARSVTDPLRWSAVSDMSRRAGLRREDMRSSWSAFRTGRDPLTGQALTYSRALATAVGATGRFTTALMSATAGATRLGLAAGGRLLARGAAAAGRGVMNMLGGPWGMALAGGLVGYNLVRSSQQDLEDFRSRLADDDGASSAINKYSSALGLAGQAAISFAETLRRAERNVPVTDATSRNVSTRDVSAANVAGRSLTNTALSGMTAQQASVYVSNMVATPGVTPEVLQAAKLDLLQLGVPAEQVEQVLRGEYSTNLSDMIRRDATNPFAYLRSLVSAGSGTQSDLNAAVATAQTRLQGIYSQYGTEESNQYTITAVNQLLDYWRRNGSSMGAERAVAASIEELLGGEKLGLSLMDFEAIREAETPQERTDAFLRAIQGSAAGRRFAGMDFRDIYAREWSAPTTESLSPMQQAIRSTRAGRVAYGSNMLGSTIQRAVAQPNDANLNLRAATTWAQQMVVLSGTTSAAISDFQALKGAIHDIGDPLYQLAASAQSAAERLQNYEMGMMSAPQRAAVVRQNLVSAYNSDPTAPDYQERVIAAEDAYAQAQQQLRSTLESAWRAFREFDISQARAQADFATSRARQEQDYWISRRQSQEDFNLSRRRAEDDFNHQVLIQARQTAKQMQDIYQMVYTQPTWAADNLLMNSQDQLARMRQQQADLAAVRRMGLSGEAIDLLGLNDFSNQQQLARLLSDFMQNPALVEEFNRNIAGRLDVARAFTTDENSLAWQEMRRSFELSAQRAEEDYDRMINRSEEAYRRSVERTTSDWAKQMSRAQEDLNRSFEVVTMTFEQLQSDVLSRMSGTAKAQMEEMIRNLGTSRDTIKGAAYQTAQDVYRAMSALYTLEAQAAGKSDRSGGGPVRGGGNGPAFGGGEGGDTMGDTYQRLLEGVYSGSANPVMGRYRNTSGFGYRLHPITGRRALHTGQDMAAPTGTGVAAAMPGVVLSAGLGGSYGNLIKLLHPDGRQTWYAHLSAIDVRPGQMVNAGDRIGAVGSTGRSTGPHLHFELRVNGRAVDPSGFLGTTGQTGMLSLGSMIAQNPGMKSIEDAHVMAPGIPEYQRGMATMGLINSVMRKMDTAMDVSGWYRDGAIFTGPRKIGVGENGPETVLPLNEVGAQFLANVLSRFHIQPGTSEAPLAGRQVVQAQTVNYYQKVDQAQHFGENSVIVKADDPNKIFRALQEKQRQQRLVFPDRGGYQ